MLLNEDAELVKSWLLDITSTGGAELDGLAMNLAEQGYAEGLK